MRCGCIFERKERFKLEGGGEKGVMGHILGIFGVSFEDFFFCLGSRPKSPKRLKRGGVSG